MSDDNKKRDELAEHLDKIPLGLQAVMGYSISKAFRDGWNARDEYIEELKAEIRKLSEWQTQSVELEPHGIIVNVRARGIDYITSTKKKWNRP